MNVLLSPSRRQAERFAEALDAGTTDPRFAEALATVATLRSAADIPAPRADFTADLRARLMAEADTALVATDQRLFLPERSTTGRRQGRATAVVAALVIVGGSAGISVAAQNSLPGEGLYSIKRGIEHTHEALTFSNAAQGRALLDQASSRLTEAQRLTKLGRDDDAAATLDQFAATAGSGADLLFRDYQKHPDVDGVTAVREFAGTSMGDLDALADKAPASMRPSLVAAAQLLADLDQQARVLCADCGARSPLAEPTDLALAAAPSLDLLLVDRAEQAPVQVAKPAKAKPTKPATPVIPDVSGALDGATAGGGTPATSGSGSTPALPKPSVPSSAPTSLPETVGTVTNGVGQIVTGTVTGLTDTVNQLTNLTGLTPKK